MTNVLSEELTEKEIKNLKGYVEFNKYIQEVKIGIAKEREIVDVIDEKELKFYQGRISMLKEILRLCGEYYE